MISLSAIEEISQVHGVCEGRGIGRDRRPAAGVDEVEVPGRQRPTSRPDESFCSQSASRHLSSASKAARSRLKPAPPGVYRCEVSANQCTTIARARTHLRSAAQWARDEVLALTGMHTAGSPSHRPDLLLRCHWEGWCYRLLGSFRLRGLFID